MDPNSEMYRHIRIQQWSYEARNRKKPRVIVIHPEFYYNMEMKIRPDIKAELYGMEVEVCGNIKPNEFILGEKYIVEVK